MPVSGSDKLDLPVLGRRFSEKAEHLPIKKRRFLFRTPSPPHNTSEVTENSSSQELHPKPVASLTVANIDNKVHEETTLKSSDDICGISLGSYGIKSLKSPATVKLEASSMNIPNISGKETGLHISKVDNSTSDNQVTSQGHKSAVCDERLNWDLNTVMPWEESESPDLDHNIQTMFSEEKKRNPKVCKQEQVCGNPPEIISNQTITNLRIFPHAQKPEEHKKPISIHHINKLLFPVMSTSTSTSTSPPSSHVTVKSEYPHPPCDISSKNSSNFPFSMPAGIGLSLGYDHMRPSEENVGLSKSTANNHAITCTQTTEDENLNLSLVTVSSLEKQVQQTGTNYEEDDKTKVKNVITKEDAYKPINESVTGSLEGEDQPSAVTDAQVVIKTEKSPPLTPPSVTYTKEVVGQFENLPSDIQGSEVDNAEEFSVGYDSQFEDGEVRWEVEGSEGDNRENEHDTNNNNNRGIRITTDECAPESSSKIKSTDIDSQKATDEVSISSVLLPEKPDTSEHVSNSQPNETDTLEISMKDESESNQWKMNVSGSDDYSNVTKIKDLTSVKLYKRDPSTRDEFINRGSRFRIQSYSSTNGGDDTGSRSLRPFRRGKYSPHVRTSNRGGATWNRDRDPPFFRDPDNLTTEVNDDVIRPGPPYPTRTQSFRTRPVSNREEDDFRARLGLRPAGDTRFVTRGRPLRYGSAGRYGGPADGGYNEPLDYPHSHSFQRRDNHPCVHHLSGSTSPPRSRTRSRSPRIRRPRSPGYRFEPDGYNHNNNNNNNSNSPRWVKYKQQSSGFHRSPPPIGERLSFYNDSSRKTNYRGGRYSDGVMEHGYRRGGFVKRHEMGRPVKHMEYDEEDGCGVEFGNGKPYNSNNNGSESRFSRRGSGSREER